MLHAAVPHRELSDVVAACDEVDTAFRYAWKVEHTNWTVDARLQRVFERLGEQPSEAAASKRRSRVGRRWSSCTPSPDRRRREGDRGAGVTLPARICSDAIVSHAPCGSCSKKRSRVKYFSSFAFSDEVGRQAASLDV